MIKPLICLCSIVGNEEDVIERFIRSFEPIIDRAIFVVSIGNQKPDKTVEIIERVCEELEIDVSILDYKNRQPWDHVDDFAAARSVAWNGAVDTECAYLIWADADDLLKDGSAELLIEAAQSGRADVFIVPYEVRGKSQIIYRERMVRNDGCSFWNFPVHELLQFNRDVTYNVLSNAAIIHVPLATKKHQESRNRTILEHSIKDGARNLFFLSQEAVERGQIETFAMYAHAALLHPGLDVTERYEILISLAQCAPDNGLGHEKSKDYASRAYDLMPDRREALALLACYALVDGRNEEAYYLAKNMVSLPLPKKAYWTLNRDWYTWKGLTLFCQTLRAIGKVKEALELEMKHFNEAGATFSICHPTYLRPHQALAVREQYLSKASNPMAVEYIFGIHHDDKESLKILSGHRHTVTNKEGCTPNSIEALRASSGKFIMVIADDLFPSDGWDDQILKKVGDLDRPIALNFNDSLRADGHMCHPFVTRPYLKSMLSDPWPGTGIYSDNEFTYRARKAGVVVDAPEIVFEHRHYSNGKAPIDATYLDQNQKKNYDEGLKLFKERNPDASP